MVELVQNQVHTVLAVEEVEVIEKVKHLQIVIQLVPQRLRQVYLYQCKHTQLQ